MTIFFSKIQRAGQNSLVVGFLQTHQEDSTTATGMGHKLRQNEVMERNRNMEAEIHSSAETALNLRSKIESIVVYYNMQCTVNMK